MLQPCADLSPADWITGSELRWGRLVCMGPAGFAAYARLRFIPDPRHPGQSENDVDVGPDLPTEHARLGVALELLRNHTRTPDEVYYCIWDGWDWSWRGREADVHIGVTVTDELELAARSYFLLQGTLSDFDGWETELGTLSRPLEWVPPPAFVWPADRAWCVANDVDPHYAGIGASTAAIDELLETAGVDVVRADPAEEQPAYR
jgi:hypothetical protein